MGYKVGRNCRVYYSLTGIGGTPTWVELKIAEEVSPTDEKGEAEINNRESPFTKVLTGQHSLAHEVRLTYKSGNAGYEALRDAYHAGSDIAIAVMDGPIATVGSEGWQYDAKVTKFPRSEPLTDGVTIAATLRPSADSAAEPEYVEVTA